MIFNISAIRNFPTVAVRHSGNIQDEVIQFHFALPFIALAFPFGTGLPPPSSKTKDKTHSVQRQINLFSIALHSTSNALQNITLDEVSRGERWGESSEECSDLACMEELVLLRLVQNKKIFVATVAGYVGESVYVFLSLISLSKINAILPRERFPDPKATNLHTLLQSLIWPVFPLRSQEQRKPLSCTAN